MSDKYEKINEALDNAAMSARMEGYSFTQQMRKQCMDVLTGVKTLQECIEEINMKYANMQR